MMGDLSIPVMVIGGVDNEETLPSCAANVQCFICRVFAKSIVKVESVENFVPSMIAPDMSVAPNEASLKLQPVRLEYAKHVLKRDVPMKLAPLQ